MIMLLTCTSISVMASDVQSDTADQDEKMTIGVSVESVSVSEFVLVSESGNSIGSTKD